MPSSSVSYFCLDLIAFGFTGLPVITHHRPRKISTGPIWPTLKQVLVDLGYKSLVTLPKAAYDALALQLRSLACVKLGIFGGVRQSRRLTTQGDP
jgi:hypothetical protein